MKVSEIAKYVGGTVVGDGEKVIRDIKGIDEAGEGEITFIANPKYRSKLEGTAASAVIVSPDIEKSDKTLIVVADPYVSFARLLALFYPDKKPAAKISEDAFIGKDAKIAKDATIFPGAYIGEEAVIGNGAIIYPGVFVGDSVVIGDGSVLYPNVAVYRRCIIGKNVTLHAGVVVGSDGFGFTNPGAENMKVPQTGIVQIDDNVEIGANTTIDRGTLGKTWIKEGAKIDNLVQIAHNVVVGENSIIVSQVGISGSTKLGRGVVLGGQAGLVGHINIGDHVMVAAQTGVHEDVLPRQVISGSPHMPHRDWLKAQACFSRLPEMRNSVKSLSKKVKELEEKIKKMGRDT